MRCTRRPIGTAFTQHDDRPARRVRAFGREYVRPITDVDLSLGPVRASAPAADDAHARRHGVRGRRLRGEDPRATARFTRSTMRRLRDDEYVAAFPERVVTAEMRRCGDVLFFDQYTYHRGLPNDARTRRGGRRAARRRADLAWPPWLRARRGRGAPSPRPRISTRRRLRQTRTERRGAAKRASRRGARAEGRRRQGDPPMGRAARGRRPPPRRAPARADAHRGVSADSQNQKAT